MTETVDFTPAEKNGTQDVTFTFDASAIAPTTVVAFESMEYKKIEVAVHADIEDEEKRNMLKKFSYPHTNKN